MTLADRAGCYANVFADRPASWLHVTTNADGEERLVGEWQFGQDYRNSSDFYGAFPGDFLQRLAALFPEHQILPGMLPFGTGMVLHAFSGSLGPGHYDRCDTVQPAEFQCDVRDLPDRVSLPYDLVVADPPYSDEDAAKYKAPPLDRGALTAALAQVTRLGGYLAWLDTAWPMHRRAEWRDAGHVYVLRSTNHRVRLLTLFERVDRPEMALDEEPWLALAG